MNNSIKDTKYGVVTSNKFNKQFKKIIKLCNYFFLCNSANLQYGWL